MMSKAALETLLRNDILNKISTLLSTDFDTDVLTISASEIVIPVLDAEGNEKWACIRVSIPRGARNGEGGYSPYDGYAAAEEYRLEREEKEAKKAAADEKKKAKIAADERKRAEKKKMTETGE